MTTKRQTTFNQMRSIKSELSSEQEREDKVAEMEARGYQVARYYEREVTFNDWVATGYHRAKFRHKGESSSKKYGVVFRPSSVDSNGSLITPTNG